jgi:hypothetical protein
VLCLLSVSWVFPVCLLIYDMHLRWQLGHSATVFSIVSSPPCASQAI